LSLIKNGLQDKTNTMNKTILITGSTDGIGKLAAIKLAKDSHTIYLHGRNAEKLTQVIAEVKAQSNNDNIKGFVADFSVMSEVRNMAEQIKNELPKLDVLINNAGVFKSGKPQTSDGFDIRFAVNYFAPYLLTKELMPILKQGSVPRLINVSSAAQAPVSLEGLAGQSAFSEQASYAQSKLALTMWSFYLAKAEPNISVIAVNPGSLLNTNMVREAYGRYWSSADKGGNILHGLAVSDEYVGVTGKYFDNDKGEEIGMFGDAHSDAYDHELNEKLIRSTKMILNLN